MPKKQCPLIIPANYLTDQGLPMTLCLQENCALWNEYFGRCGLIAQGTHLGFTAAEEESDADEDHSPR